MSLLFKKFDKEIHSEFDKDGYEYFIAIDESMGISEEFDNFQDACHELNLCVKDVAHEIVECMGLSVPINMRF